MLEEREEVNDVLNDVIAKCLKIIQEHWREREELRLLTLRKCQCAHSFSLSLTHSICTYIHSVCVSNNNKIIYVVHCK